MSTKEQFFKDRLVTVMRELKATTATDPEAMWMVGNFATGLVDLYKVKTWSQFKAKLTTQAYDRLLKDFEQRGNAYHQEGKAKAAFAIELLAISTVAKTQTDQTVKQGERLLDGIINGMVASYRKTRAAEAARAR